MEISISQDILMKYDEMPRPLVYWLREQLKFNNPQYVNAQKYGFSTHGISKYICLYKEFDEYFSVPRGIGNELIRYLRKENINYTLVDRRVLLPKVNFKSHIQLRDYQKKAIRAMLMSTQGFLVAPCGAGKTVMMVEMACQLKQPTLFIVHQKELMEQIINTVVALTDVERDEIGIIGSGNKTIGERVTVATIQTLNRVNLRDYTEKFGAIFIDEAHHLAAKSFYDVISKFKGCYRFAVSATPRRQDGLTEMVYSCAGGIVHEIKQSSVPTIIPSLRKVQTAFLSFSEDYTDIVKELILNEARNQLIVDCIKAEATGNYCLVLSDRIEHLEILKPMLLQSLPELRVEILTGNLPKTKRNELMSDARNRNIDILLATQLAREGLDIPHLNRLFLTYPKKSAASVQQEVGRIMRPAEGKKDAVVYDFIDDRNGILESQYRKRSCVYKQIGMRY